MMSSSSSGWSVLPSDLLVDIVGRLRTLQDFYAVRAVCHNWRIIASPIPSTLASQSPILLLPKSLYDVVLRRFYSFPLPWNTGYCHTAISYSHGYVIAILSRFPSCSIIILWNIFTLSPSIKLPENPHPFLGIRLSARPDSSRCLVVLFTDNLNIPGRLQYLNVGDTHWNIVSSPCNNYFLDMIFYKGELLAVTKEMKVLSVELVGHSLRVRKFGDIGLPRLPQYSNMWLGELDGALLLVVLSFADRTRRGCFTMFRVFQWWSSENKWEEIHCLGDKALLVSVGNNAVSVSATPLGLRNNCIYGNPFHPHELYVFSLEDKSTKWMNVDCRGGFAIIPNMPIWPFPSYC